MSRQKLFGSRIAPACAHCKLGSITADGRMVLCPRKGVTQPFDSCRKYRYDPLKRTPAPMAELPSYDKDEFKL